MFSDSLDFSKGTDRQLRSKKFDNPPKKGTDSLMGTGLDMLNELLSKPDIKAMSGFSYKPNTGTPQKPPKPSNHRTSINFRVNTIDEMFADSNSKFKEITHQIITNREEPVEPMLSASTRSMTPPLRMRRRNSVDSSGDKALKIVSFGEERNNIFIDEVKSVFQQDSEFKLPSANFGRRVDTELKEASDAQKQIKFPSKVIIDSKPQCKASLVDESLSNEVKNLTKSLSEQRNNYQSQINSIKSKRDGEIEGLKKTHRQEKAILQAQLKIKTVQVQQAKLKALGEANNLIEAERARLKLYQQEELTRIKQMNAWERQKIEQTYQNEVETLKKTIQCLKRNLEVKYQPIQQVDIQKSTLNDIQLKAIQSNVDERERALHLKELNLRQQQNELMRTVRMQEERLRLQQRRILQAEANQRRVELEAKRHISSEKQTSASQLARLQFELAHEKEFVQHARRELQMERDHFENHKNMSQQISTEVVNEYHHKLEELNSEKQKVKELEFQLTTKIKIVELRAKQLRIESTEINGMSLGAVSHEIKRQRSSLNLTSGGFSRTNTTTFTPSRQTPAPKLQHYMSTMSLMGSKKTRF